MRRDNVAKRRMNDIPVILPGHQVVVVLRVILDTQA